MIFKIGWTDILKKILNKFVWVGVLSDISEAECIHKTCEEKTKYSIKAQEFKFFSTIQHYL